VTAADREEGAAGWKEVSACRKEVVAGWEVATVSGSCGGGCGSGRHVAGKGYATRQAPREKKTAEKKLMWTQI